MHDGGGNRSQSVEALPIIIQALRAKGYRFVTIPELLALRDPNAALYSPGAHKKAPKAKPGKPKPKKHHRHMPITRAHVA
jgi:hypothetical protein